MTFNPIPPGYSHDDLQWINSNTAQTGLTLFDPVQWQIAGDYLKEHWSPGQEETDPFGWMTDFCGAYDKFLIHQRVPYYASRHNSLPYFTQRMAQLLKEVGIVIWHTDDPAQDGRASGSRRLQLVNYP